MLSAGKMEERNKKNQSSLEHDSVSKDIDL